MNALIAIVARLIVELIKGIISGVKLKLLKSDLKKKAEAANESKKVSDKQYSDFKSEYSAWLDREERELRNKSDSMQGTVAESVSEPRKPASNNRRVGRSRKSKRGRAARARQAAKRSTKK